MKPSDLQRELFFSDCRHLDQPANDNAMDSEIGPVSLGAILLAVLFLAYAFMYAILTAANAFFAWMHT